MAALARRTPAHLLVEVILVDDASDWEIPEDILAMEKVRGIKLTKREGLIRARTVGAQAARGEVRRHAQLRGPALPCPVCPARPAHRMPRARNPG